MNVFDLVAVLTLTKKDYEEGLKEAGEEASSFGDKIKSGLATAGKVATAVGGMAVAAGAGIVKMASSSASAMDEIDKSSQKMGISVEAYQEWAHAMDLSGMSIDTMKIGMKSLRTAMSGMDEEGNSTSEEFQKLGISLTDASGNMRSAEDVMNEAISKLSDMEDGVERATIAQKLFGKAGIEMAPLLNSGSEAIAQMKQEAHDLGLVMSEDDVKAGAALNDSLSNLKQSFGAIITRLGNSLMPLVQKLSDGLIKMLPKIQQMFDKIMPLILDFAEQILPFLMDLAEALLPTIFQLLETVMPTLTMIAQSVLPIISSVLSTINPLLQALNTILQPLLKVVNAILEPLLKLVGWVFEGISDGISGIASALGEDGLFGIVGKVGEAFSTIFGGIAELLGAPFEAIKDFFNGVWEVCGKIMDWVWEKVSGVFSDIKDFLDWINPFSDDGTAEHKLTDEKKSALYATGNYYTPEELEQFAKDAEFVEKYGTWGSDNTTKIEGEITVKGVNNEDEFIGSADYTMNQVTKQMERDSRLYSYSGG